MASLLDVASRIDLVLPTDSQRTLSLTFEDENGSAIDFTGSIFLLTVKARDANDAPTGAALLTLETGVGIAGDISLGEFQPTFPETAAWDVPSGAGAYIYEVLRLVSTIAIEPVLVGRLDVVEGLS